MYSTMDKKAVSSTSLSPSNTSPLSLHKTREEAVTSDQCQPYGLMRNLLPRMTPSSSGTANENDCQRPHANLGELPILKHTLNQFLIALDPGS